MSGGRQPIQDRQPLLGSNMKKAIKKKSDEEMRREYPIADRLPGWYFRAEETSNNSWLVEGGDVWGRTVSRQGDNPDELLAACIEYARSMRQLDTVSFSGNCLFVGSEQIASFDVPISKAFSSGRLVIVLLDHGAYPRDVHRCNNLLAVDRRGRKTWVARLPSEKRADAYYKIASEEPLIVYSIASYECKIDPLSGQILSSTFFK